ncbi:hypothetical protein [Novosphingobium fluoreni]|uniref:hypothetical protein n=1 Tax=Novosphingobium fluoreni TaxID=1391222 RepID=UPI003DA189E0
MNTVLQSVVLLATFFGFTLLTSAISTATGRRYSKWSNPYRWYAPLWIVQCVILLLPLYDFGYPTSWATVGYIVLCHFALAAGISIVMFLGRGGSDADVTSSPPRGFMFMTLTGLGAQLLFSLDTLLASGVQMADRFDASGMADARDENFALSTSFLGPVLGVVIALASLSIVSMLIYAYASGAQLWWARRKGLTRIAVYASIALVIVDTLFVRIGRFPVLIIFVMFMVARSLGREAAGIRTSQTVSRMMMKPVRLSIIGAIVGMGLIGGTWVQQMRANGLEPNQQLQAAFEVTLKPEIKYGFASSDFTTFLCLQVLYFAHSFNVLSVYVDTPSQQLPKPMMGTYNFSQPYKIVGRALPGYDPEFWSKGRADLFDVVESRGRLGNTWGTQLRDFAADFTYPGAVVFMFLLGALSQWVTDKFYRDKTYLDAIFLSLIRVFFLFSAFHSLLYSSVLGWPFCICGGIWIGRTLLFRRKASQSAQPPAFSAEADRNNFLSSRR